MKNKMTKWTQCIAAIVLIFCVSQSNARAEEVRIAILDSGSASYVDYAKSFTSFPADSDPLSHGTHVAKIVRAENPNAQIHMLQVCENLDGKLTPSPQAIIQAINWAMENDIDIINMSLVTHYNADIENLVRKASTEKGIIFVAAAGNRSVASYFAMDAQGFVTKNAEDVKPSFPSSSPYVISVGALNKQSQITKYSSKFADIYADGQIAGQEGTSFASARITAKASQILAGNPTVKDKDQILSLLK